MKRVILFLIPMLLSANLTYTLNYSKELQLLNSFDVDDSFIYDPVLNEMKRSLKKHYRTKHFFKAMDDAYIFIPSIKNILAEYGVPKEFLYLAMAESNFYNTAYSKKRAAGLWQFMPQTAKLYGLKIDEYVDERRDPIKSTKAAAKYLTYLHKKFGKWYLAAVAYNCGEGRVYRAIKRAHTDDLRVLLNPKKRYLPRESRLYIRKILALALLANDEQFLIDSEYSYLLNRANAYSLATVHLGRGASLKELSKQVGIPFKELKRLNRHLKYNFLPPYKDGYEIYIPYIKLADFKQKYHPAKNGNLYMVYHVKGGDNLSKIGKKFGVSYKVIMDFNNLKSSRLRLRQKLIIPIERGKRGVKRIKSKHYYIVKRGDTLRSISRKYRVSIENIKLQNHLKTNIIRVGERLKIYE
ncbi:Membrane-bound lytic murein transglycosylase D precursor [hydrothermal vent metagenome]|uniref:Membrane-bound lytic murein transglycosylase D n=1 Tax=hydrothermal vent metagenome TaxID=652676 RepID=A0A1W1BG37_9ZZZZ